MVIGPEAPLVDGVADLLRADGVPVFGPNADGAQLEGSKAYSKEFMMANDIPTAAYGRFDNEADALAYVREQAAPIVIKLTLAAGKGVVVAETVEDAEAAVRACFDGAFGDAGSTVVIEECMTGPECSLLCFVTAGQSFPMAPAQDHKRAYDGDLGPNTGGMGVYSPVPIVTDEEMAAMVAIMEKAAAATAREPFASDYRGTLYGGFMLTPEGPKIVEFNVRFGDPRPRSCCPFGKRPGGGPCSPWPRDDPRMCSWSGPTTGPFPWCSPARAIRLLREGQGHLGYRRGRGAARRDRLPCRHPPQL